MVSENLPHDLLSPNFAVVDSPTGPVYGSREQDSGQVRSSPWLKVGRLVPPGLAWPRLRWGTTMTDPCGAKNHKNLLWPWGSAAAAFWPRSTYSTFRSGPKHKTGQSWDITCRAFRSSWLVALACELFVVAPPGYSGQIEGSSIFAFAKIRHSKPSRVEV